MISLSIQEEDQYGDPRLTERKNSWTLGPDRETQLIIFTYNHVDHSLYIRNRGGVNYMVEANSKSIELGKEASIHLNKGQTKIRILVRIPGGQTTIMKATVVASKE